MNELFWKVWWRNFARSEYAVRFYFTVDEMFVWGMFVMWFVVGGLYSRILTVEENQNMNVYCGWNSCCGFYRMDRMELQEAYDVAMNPFSDVETSRWSI